MMGTVFNLQKFSINDGPGIRTTVFLKGCPLRCLWCHNPESKAGHPELFYAPAQCIGCRACETVCPHHCHTFAEEHNYQRETCTACGLCASACVSRALEVTGQVMTVDDVIQEVLKDKIFYDNSGGGITLSGGEPFFQYDFSLALLRAAKDAGLHTAMETCGFTTEERCREIAPYVDLFLFDCKETDPIRHKEYTGVSSERILDNLFLLDALGAKIILRCPIIPGYNDREEHLLAIAALANRLTGVLGIDIEPYHPLGVGKSERLGKPDPLSAIGFPEEATVKGWIDTVAAHTAVPVKKA